MHLIALILDHVPTLCAYHFFRGVLGMSPSLKVRGTIGQKNVHFRLSAALLQELYILGEAESGRVMASGKFARRVVTPPF